MERGRKKKRIGIYETEPGKNILGFSSPGISNITVALFKFDSR